MSTHEASNEGANVESSEGAIFRSLQQIIDRLARLEDNRPPAPPELRPREPLARPRRNRDPNPESLSDDESDVGPRHRPRERVVEEITDHEDYHRRRAPTPRERVVEEIVERRYPPRRRGHRPRARVSDEESEYDDPPLRPLRPRDRIREDGSDASETPGLREHPHPRARPPRWADVVEEEGEHEHRQHGRQGDTRTEPRKSR
ncbi:PREDICTED: serine/arginine-rich splicing factor SR45-like [Tarenaya hassleriana]|uniref:serine/arginine-rich splicing factor SR45-like n=1 Tax=Tarenaya hassleriana TaxID=28532 RepID=UPI00053C375F|nr:PREDICTED: serine/arginine-rich splicing factor SR45-like [Tarenaya hassleriana]